MLRHFGWFFRYEFNFWFSFPRCWILLDIIILHGIMWIKQWLDTYCLPFSLLAFSWKLSVMLKHVSPIRSQNSVLQILRVRVFACFLQAMQHLIINLGEKSNICTTRSSCKQRLQSRFEMHERGENCDTKVET